MAKTLGIRTPSGFSNLLSIAALLASAPVGTMGNICDEILKAEDTEMVVVLDLDARVVHGRAAAGVDAVALIDAVAGAEVVGALKQLADARVSVWIPSTDSAPNTDITHASAPIERVANEPALVSRNVASLVNAIDDDLALGADSLIKPFPTGGNVFMIVVDQATAVVTLIEVASANKATVRALFNSGGSLADEQRYEQIPATEGVSDTTLAFE